MGGGPTPETKTQNIDQKQSGSSTAGPPEYIKPYLEQLIQKITPYENQFSGPGGAPPLYGDSYTAAPSQTTQDAWYAMRDYGLHGLGGGITGGLNTNLTNATLQGDYLNLDKNPYFQSAIEASLRAPTENFTNKVIPGLRSTFAGAGRPGGGLEGTALQEATTSFNRSVADATAKVGAQAYGDERNRQLQTQSMLPSFQGMDLARLATLAQSGAATDAYTQKLRDEDVQRFNYSQTGGLDFLTGLAQRIQGVYPGGTNEGTSTTTGTTGGTSTPAGNPGAENAKLAMAGVATAVSIAAMFV